MRGQHDAKDAAQTIEEAREYGRIRSEDLDTAGRMEADARELLARAEALKVEAGKRAHNKGGA
jgi:hypothetical protein